MFLESALPVVVVRYVLHGEKPEMGMIIIGGRQATPASRHNVGGVSVAPAKKASSLISSGF